MGFWQGFTRTAAEIEYAGHHYRVELNLVSLGKNITVLRDGQPLARVSTPARVPLGDGAVVEVDSTEHGFSRAILRAEGKHHRLHPAPGTWEAARARWANQHPALSRFVMVIATIVVVVSLLLLGMEMLELVTMIPPVQSLLGGWTFTSPIDMPPWLTLIFGIMVGAAALETALRMR